MGWAEESKGRIIGTTVITIKFFLNKRKRSLHVYMQFISFALFLSNQGFSILDKLNFILDKERDKTRTECCFFLCFPILSTLSMHLRGGLIIALLIFHEF